MCLADLCFIILLYLLVVDQEISSPPGKQESTDNVKELKRSISNWSTFFTQGMPSCIDSTNCGEQKFSELCEEFNGFFAALRSCPTVHQCDQQ